MAPAKSNEWNGMWNYYIKIFSNKEFLESQYIEVITLPVAHISLQIHLLCQITRNEFSSEFACINYNSSVKCRLGANFKTIPYKCAGTMVIIINFPKLLVKGKHADPPKKQFRNAFIQSVEQLIKYRYKSETELAAKSANWHENVNDK